MAFGFGSQYAVEIGRRTGGSTASIRGTITMPYDERFVAGCVKYAH
jgi:hypothetical protein